MNAPAASDKPPVILVTGMSGAGKTTALRELAHRGHDTVDTDDGDWIEVVDGEPLWREHLVTELLALSRERALFVQGTVANQGRFYDRFDAVVLMTAPLEVMLSRVATRSAGEFGTTAADREKITRDQHEFEPMLRRGATHEIDTSAPVTDVADELVHISETARPGIPR